MPIDDKLHGEICRTIMSGISNGPWDVRNIGDDIIKLIETAKSSEQPDEYASPKRELQQSDEFSSALYRVFSKRNAGEILAYLNGVLEDKYPMPSELITPKRESGGDVESSENEGIDN